MLFLSLGAGVQSTCMAMMAEHGEIDKPDYAIFADTGWEPQYVYDQLEWIKERVSFPIIHASKGNIKNDLIDFAVHKKRGRFAAIPFFAKKFKGTHVEAVMGRRQCTREYKIEPLEKKMRELLGYKPRLRIPANSCRVMIGITTDEIVRMKPAHNKWQVNEWPLIDLRMNRTDCLNWMRDKGYPLPRKSSCIGCPYHDNKYWRYLRNEAPTEFADAVETDKIIRSRGTLKGMDAEQYMHRSLKPLGEVDFDNDVDRGQIDMFLDECEGMCGV